LAVACNLGAEPVQVPITGEVVLCSASPSVGANTAEIQPYSFAILRSVDTLSTGCSPKSSSGSGRFVADE
jgi:hypothetical protein